MAIGPELAARIEAFRRPGVSVRQLHAQLLAAGINVALRTLHRHLDRQDAATRSAAEAPLMSAAEILAAGAAGAAEAAAGDGAEPLADFSPATILADMQARYVEVRHLAQRLRTAAALGGKDSKSFYDAVRLLGDLGKTLAALAPPPVPDPEHDPALVAAKERLLARARELAAKARAP